MHMLLGMSHMSGQTVSEWPERAYKAQVFIMCASVDAEMS